MSFEKFSNNKNNEDYSREHERPQELIDLEWNVSNRYIELAGIPPRSNRGMDEYAWHSRSRDR